jgi:hypothetical protein
MGIMKIGHVKKFNVLHMEFNANFAQDVVLQR